MNYDKNLDAIMFLGDGYHKNGKIVAWRDRL
jgi:hypothetical protein